MDVKTALASLGWRVDTDRRLDQAIRDFQAMWNLGSPLTSDGDPGPKTLAALALSLLSKAAGRGDISEHFNAREFACNCGGRWDDCRRIWTPRAVIRAAEMYRDLVGPFTPERAGRCPTENARVGGVSNSQHLYGLALDVPVFKVTAAQAKALGVFSGIGVYLWQGNRYVRHLDLRHLRGSTSTPSNPAAWDYGTAKTAPLTPAPVTATAPALTPAPVAPQEDDLSDADVQKINDYTRALLLTGYTTGGADSRAMPSINDRLIGLEATVTAMSAAVATLANSVGINPELAATILREEVRAKLDGLKVTVATTEESA